MAQEELVKQRPDAFFRAVQKMVVRLRKETDHLYYAAIHQMGRQPRGEWTFLAGSEDLAQDPYEGMARVIRTLNEELSAPFRLLITKTGILRPDDPFFLALTGAILVEPPPKKVVIERCSFNGIEIRLACLFIASRRVSSKVRAVAKPAR